MIYLVEKTCSYSAPAPCRRARRSAAPTWFKHAYVRSRLKLRNNELILLLDFSPLWGGGESSWSAVFLEVVLGSSLWRGDRRWAYEMLAVLGHCPKGLPSPSGRESCNELPRGTFSHLLTNRFVSGCGNGAKTVRWGRWSGLLARTCPWPIFWWRLNFVNTF